MLDRLDWHDIPEEDARGMAAQHLFNDDPVPLQDVVLEARRAELPFYRGVRLVWVILHPGEGVTPEHLFLLEREGGAVALTGIGGPVHATNAAGVLDVDESTAADYLRFFCFAVRGDEGPFQIFEAAVDGADGERAAEVAALARPVELVERNDEGHFIFQALVRYSTALFETRFAVDPAGMVSMLEDEQVADDVPMELFPPVPPLRPLPELKAAVWKAVSQAIPGSDTRRVMIETLLERALGEGTESRILAQFNARRPNMSPLENFAHMLVAAAPVVAVESTLPFVEETVADIAREILGKDRKLRVFAADPDQHDEAKLRIRVPPTGPALGLLPLHAYGSVADVERVAYQISARNLACLIGCPRIQDLPPALAQVVDLTVRLPRVDAPLFEILFRRTLGMVPPEAWEAEGTHWLNHLHHSDFQQPAGLGLEAAEALEFIRGRAEARLRDVEPVAGLGLSELHGLGEARTFAEDLISDIHEAVAGRLDWMHVDRGVLLVGEPGTGKTTLARAIAKDCGIRFINASATEWQSAGHLGDHLRAMRADFARARRFAPAILFIDEIDSIGNRAEFSGSNAQYAVEVVNALLELIQGMDPEAPVLVMGATNFEHRVDAALKRAGRLDRVIRIPRPNTKALAQIFEHHLREYTGDTDLSGLDLEQVSGLSLGATGADVDFFVRGAVRRARRAGRPLVQGDLVDEVTRKPQDPDSAPRLSPEDTRRVAVHEAGHALAACLTSSGGAQLSFITIVPRSDGSLGFVASMPSEAVFLTRTEYMERLEVILAGRAAEELVFGAAHVTTGAGGPAPSSDLAVATRTALQLITRYGLGPDGDLLWTDGPDRDQREQANALLASCYAAVKERLAAARDRLDALTEALVESQELTGDQVRKLAA